MLFDRVWPSAYQLTVVGHDRISRIDPALRSGEWKYSQGPVNSSPPSLYNSSLYAILKKFHPLLPMVDM